MPILHFIFPSLLFLYAIPISITFQEDNFLDGQLTLTIEDTLDDLPDASFSLRSSIHIRSVKSGNAVISHTRDWGEEDIAKLKKLADDNGLYRIRVYQKGFPEKGYVSTFTKACLFYESGLAETLSLMIDSTGTSVVGVGLFTPVSFCERKDVLIPPSMFNSTVIVRSPIGAPIPDTATYIQKLEAMKIEKAEGKDNRSFLGRYWIYIVPIVIILLISGGQEGPPSGGGR